jgi:hypothetical protein
METPRSNQYFLNQLVTISTLRNREVGNPRKHCSFGRGGGDRKLNPLSQVLSCQRRSTAALLPIAVKWCQIPRTAHDTSVLAISIAKASRANERFPDFPFYRTYQASCDVELAKGETTIYFLRLRARNDAFAKLVPMMEGPLALRAASISASRRLLHTPPFRYCSPTCPWRLS